MVSWATALAWVKWAMTASALAGHSIVVKKGREFNIMWQYVNQDETKYTCNYYVLTTTTFIIVVY